MLPLYRFIDKNLISSPHRLVPLATFFGILIYFLTNAQNPIYTGAPSDPDDYMRLNEVINWLQGQGWYDLSQPRLSPGAHTIVHWSRLLDMPLALLMWPFVQAQGLRGAAIIAALIEPLILLAFLLALVPAMVRPLVGRAKSNLAVLFVPFIASLLFNFSPGRVDHHNWDILIAGIGLMALQYMVLCRGGWKVGIFAGVSFAVSLWISPEILPPLVLTLGCLALFAPLRGGFVLRNAAVFGTAFAAATAALLPAALPVVEWGDRTISWFSTAYVIFAILTGAAFVLTWLLGRQTEKRILRLALMTASGGFAAILFVYFVPAALAGPFADYDDFDATVALDTIGEAEPLIRGFQLSIYNHLVYVVDFVNFLHYLLPETLSLLLCVFAFWKSPPRRRILWSIYAICLGGTTAMALLLQYRVIWFAQIFQLGPMAYLVWRWWGRFEGRWTASTCTQAALLMFLALGPLPVFAHMLLRNGDDSEHATCALRPVTDYLAHTANEGGSSVTILAGADEGPELLFRTPDNVLAGNFNVPANKDVFDFFGSHDDAEAFAILRKWHVDRVLTCRHIPPVYAGTNHPKFGKNAFLKLGPDGKLHIVSSLTRPSLAERLVNGQVPDWLKPVEIPGASDYLLFEVHLPQAETQNP